MKLTLKLTGSKPLLMHNGRLANPIDPYTRAVKALTGKKKKTDDDLMLLMQTEARGGAYETLPGYCEPGSLLGLPDQVVWSSIYWSARTFFRAGPDIKRALIVDAENVEPITVDGAHVTVDSFLGDPNHIDYRPVKVMAAKTMRARPKVPAGWESTHTFELLEDVLDARDLVPKLQRAGRLIGIGDWRPTYGTYEIEVL